MNLSSVDARLSTLQRQLTSRSTARIALETLTFDVLHVIGLVGNSLVLWIVNKKRHQRKTINLFVGALAVSDLLLIVNLACFSSPSVVLGKWPFSGFFCQFHGLCIALLASASLLLMAVTAVNRYLQVVHANYYRRLFTRKRTKLFIYGTWALASISPIQYLASGELYFFNPGKLFCFQGPDLNPNTLFVYISGGTSMFVVLLCYQKIFQTIRNHQGRVTAMQQNTNPINGPNIQDIKITRTLFLTVVGFVCCWTPILIIDFIDLARGTFSFPRELYLFYSWLGALSSVINPFIYGVMNPMFREEFKRIYLRVRCIDSSQVEVF
ncbi:melatonin receptor type 1A [Nematostella vectensis]|uniref:melatonin receptor type 1A n=1 Tax=Nematostella vectensis TaxID=45351 RepID=UPI00138FA739|nr:melatonin receptor type 1A [Nematostella vectensis]